LVSPAPSVRAQQASPKRITLAAVVDAMEARQKLTASVMVRWNDDHWYRGPGGVVKQNGFTCPSEMLIRGDSMRYSTKCLNFVGGSVSLVERDSSYDGNESRYFVASNPPRGGILKEKGNHDAVCSPNLPLRLCYRPIAEPFATLKRKDLKLSDARKTIDGHECVQVDDGHLRVDLDCERDFVPVAFEGYLDGKRYMDGSIEYYRKGDAIAWVPKAFQVNFGLRQQGVEQRDRGSDVQTAVGAPLKDSDFALIFKPGTIVFDQRTREQYRVRDDGSKEPVGRRQRRNPPPQ
jgi:hypothetical protein